MSMKLQFFGTAAAEGVPAIFCDCEMCRYAREKGGKEIRGRSGALVDGKIKIDFGPDSYSQMLRFGLDYSHIRTLLFTHSHDDHLTVGEMECRRRGYAHSPEDSPYLDIYGNDACREKIKRHLGEDLHFHLAKPFESFVTTEGYTVTPLQGVHCVNDELPAESYPVTFEGKIHPRSEDALFYLIEKDGSSLLYAHDTDEFTPADEEFLAGRKIDCVSLDCTNGALDCKWIGHMGVTDCLRQREKLLASGAADSHTVFAAHHFSHNGLKPYEEMEKMLPGFVIAYDGLILEF